jgi:hypothetical protein
MSFSRIYTCEFCGIEYRALWRLFDHREKHHQAEISAKVGDPFARFYRRAS